VESCRKACKQARHAPKTLSQDIEWLNQDLQPTRNATHHSLPPETSAGRAPWAVQHLTVHADWAHLGAPHPHPSILVHHIHIQASWCTTSKHPHATPPNDQQLNNDWEGGSEKRRERRFTVAGRRARTASLLVVRVYVHLCPCPLSDATQEVTHERCSGIRRLPCAINHVQPKDRAGRARTRGEQGQEASKATSGTATSGRT